MERPKWSSLSISGNKMDILQLIEELEEELGKGKNFLFGKKSHIDLDRCAELIEELKNSLPPAIQEARYILSQKENIIAGARQTADKTIKEAELRAQQMVSESQIVKSSEHEAGEIINSANKRCAQLYGVTKDNIDRMLKAVEDYLVQNLQVVRNNREQLNGGLFNRPPQTKK